MTTTTTYPATDAELAELVECYSRLLDGCTLNLARLRFAQMRAACGNGAIPPDELAQMRDQTLGDQAEVAGRLAFVKVEIAFRRLTGEWGDVHAAH